MSVSIPVSHSGQFGVQLADAALAWTYARKNSLPFGIRRLVGELVPSDARPLSGAPKNNPISRVTDGPRHEIMTPALGRAIAIELE
jgi:hypothetical protein